MAAIPVDRQVVTFKATVTFTYEAEVYPGDPDDVYEILDLEKPILTDTLESVIETLGGFETVVTMTPLREDGSTY